MKYLYGDSTPSTLELDYIDFLRDAVDCCVTVLLADQRIAGDKARLEALEKSTAADLEQVQKTADLVPKVFEAASLDESASPAARCAAAIMRSAAALAAATIAEVKGALDAAVSKGVAATAQERQSCAEALERLLVKHDLPGMKSELEIVLVGAGNYVGRAKVSTEFGVSGTLELDVPKDHLFERVVRIDRLVERLDVQAPELGGWLHKEIKLRPQHLDKHYLVGLSHGATGDALRLRTAPDGSGAGCNLVFAAAGGAVQLLRVDEQNKGDDLPFDVDAADIPKLQALRDKLLAAATELTRHRRGLVDAKLDGEALRSHPTPSLLAERLVVAIAPTVQEIASRSQSPGELVLRRLIGEARREEIFLSKQELKSKVEPLNERSRALFDPLWVVPPAGASPPRVPAGPPAPQAITALPPPPPTSAVVPPPLALATFPPPPPPPRGEPRPPAGTVERGDATPASERASAPRSSPDVEISLADESR